MSYQYIEFDGAPIALFDHSQGHDAMPSEATLLDSIGGAWDWKGSQPRRGRKQVISAQGLFAGETEYLVDETGDFIVDETGDYLIAGDAKGMTASSVRAIFEKKGIRGQLIRKRLADDVKQWKTARLLTVQWPRKWDDHALRAEITCQWETAMEFWHAETATSTSVSASSGTQTALNVDNAGEFVSDAILTVTRTSGTITTVSIACPTTGISITWTGSLDAGDILTIDNGLQTIRKGSADAYSGLSLGGSHSAAGWIPLGQGANPFVITLIGGNGDVAVSHYNQYA